MTLEHDGIEREVKLEVGCPIFEVPGFAGPARPLELADHDLDAVYYDRVDIRLLDQGITVRRRSGEGTRWTVKLPAGEDRRHRGQPEAWPAGRSRSTPTTSTSPPAVRELVAPYLGGEDAGAGGPAALPTGGGWRLAAPDGVDGGRDRRRPVTAQVPRRPDGAGRGHVPGGRGRVRGRQPRRSSSRPWSRSLVRMPAPGPAIPAARSSGPWPLLGTAVSGRGQR